MHATITLQMPNQLIATLRAQLNRQSKGSSLAQWVNLIRGVAGGTDRHRGFIRTVLASRAAAGVINVDVSDAVAATDTVVIAGTTLSYVTTPANQDQFAVAATDALGATELARAINAHTTLQKIVRAFAVGADVYVVSIYPGPIGNLITTTETGDGFTVESSSLQDGASDAPETYQIGYTPGATAT